MKYSLSLFLFLLLVPILSLSQNTSILFVGNSYTYVNDLPQLVKDIALSKGDSVTTDMSAPGGYTFQSHCTNSTTLAKINSGSFDFVVLQEQSQLPAFPPSQVATDVYPYAKQLDSLIHRANSCATTVFYMTWGRKYGDASNCSAYPPICTYSGMQERLRESYKTMADSNSALVAPAGMAWNTSWSTDSSINLWQSDNSHPSLEGSYLTACTMYATIFRKSPLGAFVPTGLDSTTASFMQDIAVNTVLDSLTNWNIGLFDCKADFSFNTNLLTAQFSNQSQNATYNHWRFGDGTTSATSNPLHTYTSSGTYNVTLVVGDSCVSDSITKAITVTTTGITSPNIPALTVKSLGNNIFIVSNITATTDYSIVDYTGKIVERGTINKGEHSFDLKKSAAGYYLLQLNSETVKSIPLVVK
jgi:PKD domain